MGWRDVIIGQREWHILTDQTKATLSTNLIHKPKLWLVECPIQLWIKYVLIELGSSDRVFGTQWSKYRFDVFLRGRSFLEHQVALCCPTNQLSLLQKIQELLHVHCVLAFGEFLKWSNLVERAEQLVEFDKLGEGKTVRDGSNLLWWIERVGVPLPKPSIVAFDFQVQPHNQNGFWTIQLLLETIWKTLFLPVWIVQEVPMRI